MVRFSSLLAAAACFVAAESVNIKVDNKGGNATSGHQYGFLHEVGSIEYSTNRLY